MASRVDVALGEERARSKARELGDWETKDRILLSGCTPKQLGYVLDPGLRIAVVTARGSGKTTAGEVRFVRRMGRTRGARCLYIANTRGQAESLIWTPLKELLDKLEIRAKFNETKLLCQFLHNGSTLKLASCDDKKVIEQLRGQPFHEVGVDETQSAGEQILEHLVFRIIAPRLGDFNGALWLNGTPGHHLSGAFYSATRPGSDIARDWEDRDKPECQGFKGWSVHRWGLQDGAPYVPAIARLLEAAYAEKERNGWSDEHPVWRREYLGQWAADDTERIFKYASHDADGAELNQWDPERGFMGVAKLPPGHDWQFIYGMDMGHSDPFALCVLAYAPTHPTLFHVYEFSKKGMYARTIAEFLLGPDLDHEKPTGLFKATGHPMAMVADMAGLGGAVLEELATVYGIRVEPAEKKNKFDAIELTNGDFIDGRIKILKGSDLERELIHLQWVVDEFGRLKEKKGESNHNSDALTYARRRAMHLFKEEQPDPRPARGTLASRDLEVAEEEDRAARKPDEFENYLGDESFNRFFD